MTGTPPWKLNPELDRWSSVWLEHPARERWQNHVSALRRDERVTYFETLRPIPVPWMDVVASLIENDWETDPLELLTRVEAETGLVNAAAWKRYAAE